MAEQHRAKPWQWETIERKRYHAEFSVILELRDRIKALEAAQPAKSNHPSKPDGSLKERIKSRMNQSSGSTWEVFTASVLTEVAAWMRKESRVHFDEGAIRLGETGLYWAQRLEQEANQ